MCVYSKIPNLATRHVVGLGRSNRHLRIIYACQSGQSHNRLVAHADPNDVTPRQDIPARIVFATITIT